VRPLKATLFIIGVFQLALGVIFLIAPAGAATMLGLVPAAPGWVNWLFAMMAARFLGYAYGMFWAARHLDRTRTWIDTMIVIQTIDWIATIGYLVAGDVTIGQVTTASFMPAVFVALLLWFHPRRSETARSTRSSTIVEPTVSR
jgi:hypothetical protein